MLDILHDALLITNVLSGDTQPEHTRLAVGDGLAPAVAMHDDAAMHCREKDCLEVRSCVLRNLPPNTWRASIHGGPAHACNALVPWTAGKVAVSMQSSAGIYMDNLNSPRCRELIVWAMKALAMEPY